MNEKLSLLLKTKLLKKCVVTVELYHDMSKTRVIDDGEFDFLNSNLMIIVWDILPQQITISSKWRAERSADVIRFILQESYCRDEPF